MRSEQKPGPVQNSRLKRASLTPPTEAIATMAATNKCLAESNKSKTGGNATKKRAIRLRGLLLHSVASLRTIMRIER